MRHLTILSQTLEPLPTDRYLTLKLLYQPHTPENYEPPFFKHANPGKYSTNNIILDINNNNNR